MVNYEWAPDNYRIHEHEDRMFSDANNFNKNHNTFRIQPNQIDIVFLSVFPETNPNQNRFYGPKTYGPGSWFLDGVS